MNKQTQKRNAAFKRATKQERAVMIAKDALKMLNAGKTMAATGNWATFEDKFNNEEVENEQICDLSDQFSECRVCALGSLMLSEVRHTNNLKFSEVAGMLEYEYEGDRLDKVFSESQQRLMEMCFEGGHGYFSPPEYVSEKVESRIKDFYKKYPSKTDRLRAILKNVIKNGGKFVLPPA